MSPRRGEGMDVVASLKSKRLYKVQLYLLKVIPMVMAFCYLLNSIFSYYDIDLEILSYLSSCSILMILFLYISSYVFRFCEYHRMFLHYIVVNTAINTYDLYVKIPLSDLQMLTLYMSISGIFLFIILYLYVKSHKRTTSKDSG